MHARELSSESDYARQASPKDDPMRRFLPTPFSAILPVMGRSVRLETNSLQLRSQMAGLFRRYPEPQDGCPQFLWRIVVDPNTDFSHPWPQRSVFSGDGLRFAQFGQRNFLAVNIEAREAIAFVAEALVEDAPGFTSPFIDTLFYMTSGSLGLVPFAAACVSAGTNALLVLGPPNQGKTTASYLAAQRGLTFHADQSVFLEQACGQLRAWGDFVPIAFRPEALQLLPELQSRARQYSYCDFTFYYVPRNTPQGQHDFVIPSCCLLLNRGSCSAPKLTLLNETECPGTLAAHLAFKDDDRFEKQYQDVLAALAKLHVYRLDYGPDPATALPFFFDLLARHSSHGSSHSAGI